MFILRFSTDSFSYLLTMTGIMRAGFPVLLISTRASSAALAHLISISGVAHVVVNEDDVALENKLMTAIARAQESDSEITINWSDETASNFNAPQLRKSCPCAGCINEWTGEKILKPEMISDDLSFTSIGIVGRYALNFKFSDGHETGIFSFQYLKQLGGKT